MKKRFTVKSKQHLSGGIIKIIVDTETGVNYIMTSGLGLSGMTPLSKIRRFISHFQGIFSLKEVKNGVEAQGLQIQNLPHKRAGNPDREDDRVFALRLQPLLGEVG